MLKNWGLYSYVTAPIKNMISKRDLTENND